MRARDIGPGCCAARATAAARWRPAGGSGRVARRGEGTARGKSGGGSLGATRGCQRKQEVAGEAAQSGGRRCPVVASVKQRKQAGGGRRGLICKFRKFQGPYCKAAITFNIGLK